MVKTHKDLWKKSKLLLSDELLLATLFVIQDVTDIYGIFLLFRYKKRERETIPQFENIPKLTSMQIFTDKKKLLNIWS